MKTCIFCNFFSLKNLFYKLFLILLLSLLYKPLYRSVPKHKTNTKTPIWFCFRLQEREVAFSFNLANMKVWTNGFSFAFLSLSFLFSWWFPKNFYTITRAINTAKNSYQAANGLWQMQKQSPENCSTGTRWTSHANPCYASYWKKFLSENES